jgi:hypothetical protein
VISRRLGASTFERPHFAGKRRSAAEAGYTAGMFRALSLLALLSACAPKDPSGTASAGGSATGTSSGDASPVSPTTTGETTAGTTDVVTIGDGSSTVGLPVCEWDDVPDRGYCPLLAAPNINLVADTPMGPVVFNYAYFGLFLCDFCPEPEFAALGLFAQEQSPGLDSFVGDYLVFEGVKFKYKNFQGRLGGQPVKLGMGAELDFPEVMFATEEEPAPPLDPDVAPTMAGKISLVGGGWMLVGDFTAGLCTTLNWSIPCE